MFNEAILARFLFICIVGMELEACSTPPSKSANLMEQGSACTALGSGWDRRSLHGMGPREPRDGNEKLSALNRCVVDFYNLERQATRARERRDSISESESGEHLAPGFCIALSGGGIRSAAFSYGILGALSKIRPLQKFDYLSSVSGGGYLSSALYANLIRRKDESLQSLLDPQGAFAKHLGTYGRNYAHWENLGVDVALIPPFTPFNIGLKHAASGVGIYTGGPYLGAVARTQARLINESFYRGTSYKDLQYPLLRDSLPIRGSTPPIPIFVATVLPVGQYTCDDLKDLSIKEHLFEFTPAAMGAPLTGYFTGEGYVNLTLADAAAVSAGAIDASRGLPCGIMKAMALDAGLTVQHVGTEYILIRDKRIRQTRSYITDGGFADNLGLVSVVNRACRKIISVDAEHDPEMKFYALQKALNHLDVFQGMPSPVFDHPSASGTFIGDAVEFPVRVFAIARVPIATPERGQGTHIDVGIDLLHIKLSLDKERIDSYRKSVKDFYQASSKEYTDGCRGDGFTERCRFPQQSTVLQSYSEEEWQAYVDLGRDIVEQNEPIIRLFLNE